MAENEFLQELLAIKQRTGHAFGYERKLAEEEGGHGFFLYRLITHSGVAHTNWVTKEAMQNYLRRRAAGK